MKLKVRNFGPIRGGFGDYIDFAKVVVFCGPQGSGKSTAAKLFSTLCWVEKWLFKMSFPFVQDAYTYEQFCADLSWQGIGDYLNPTSEIDFIGSFYRILVEGARIKVELIEDASEYKMPKIMYMPAERNFVSIIRNALRVENLPESLNNLQVEFEGAKSKYKLGYKLPSNGFAFAFNEEKGESWILNGEDGKSRTPLFQASSGLQSIVPLLLVSEYLESELSATGTIDVDKCFEKVAPEKRLLARKYFERVQAMKLEQMKEAEAIVRYMMPCTRFVNVVEEPEQNLYPSTQCEVVDRLLMLANRKVESRLVMSTHSPYVVNHLLLVAQAEEVVRHLGESGTPVTDLPLDRKALTSAGDMRLYETHLDGSITSLQGEDGYFSDENPMTRILAEFNERYAQLLELQDAHA